MVRTYTPEERAERRRRSSSLRINAITGSPDVRQRRRSSITRVESAKSTNSEASWMQDLRAQGVDIAEFLRDASGLDESEISVLEEDDEKGDQNEGNSKNELEESEEADGNDDHLPDNNRDSFARQTFRGKKITLMRRLSNLSNDTETAKNRFSSFLDQAYIIDEKTGEAVLASVEEMLQRRRENELREDSKNFNPTGRPMEELEKNKEWAISMALRKAREAGLTPNNNGSSSIEETEKSSRRIEKEVYQKVVPPPLEPLPTLDQLNLDTPAGDRDSIDVEPPKLPYKLTKFIPKRDRTDYEGGISDGMLLYGSYEQGWATCDSSSMVISCINCNSGSYLRCSRDASLVCCPKCNTVSPVGPDLISGRGSLSRNANLSDKSMNSTASSNLSISPGEGRVINRKASLSSEMTTVGWGG
mmetsp:Transcript_21661/g.45098  ORF Transcript_21661/g.45098 Transcript_21661/m.45098 type:complete len:417 (-) Transcript_21661:206-1456(-)